MADYRNGLVLIPAHMHDSVTWWIERGEPRPELMGSFLRAVLSNNLMDASSYADSQNARSLHEWAMFLYNYAPSACYGSADKLRAWYDACHQPEASP